MTTSNGYAGVKFGAFADGNKMAVVTDLSVRFIGSLVTSMSSIFYQLEKVAA